MNVSWLLLFTIAATSARSVQRIAAVVQQATYSLPDSNVTVPQFDRNNFSIFPSSKAMWNLLKMMDCVLHCNAFIYNGYGCYCGFGGSGKPVDGIDECCMHHDDCYRDSRLEHGCPSRPLLYFTPYKWDCISSTAICRLGQSECKTTLCDCDKVFVTCLAQYPRPITKPPCK